MRVLPSHRSWLILLAIAACGPARASDATDRISALVAQLGDGSFTRREAAGRDLQAIGEPALSALRAAEASKDLEVRNRARQVVRAIMLAARHSKSTGLEMALVDAGEFHMGSPANESGRRADETPRRVRITRPFLVGVHEVTQDEYRQVTGASPSWFAATGGSRDKVAGMNTARFPVEMVTWFDAVEFCNRLSRRDGYKPYYTLTGVTRRGESITAAAVTIAGRNGYRLPTEAEWEYACRAWTVDRFHFGRSSTGAEANFKALVSTGYGAATERPSLGRTARVGSYKPNPWGAFDKHGNVSEWCGDWYDKEYYARAPADDPPGPDSGRHRVVRGGSWMLTEVSCRSASRFWRSPDDATADGGFRIARSP